MLRSGSVDCDYHANMSEECVVLPIKVQPQLLVTGRNPSNTHAQFYNKEYNDYA